MAFGVWHYDGQVARRRTPRLVAQADGFILEDEWGSDGPIPWENLVAHEPLGADAVYGLKHRPGWRLGLSGEIPPEVAGRLPRPERYGRWIDRHGIARTSVAFAVIAAFGLLAILTAPRWIAPLVPSSWEQRLGDAMVGDFDEAFCNGPGGQPALDALVKKLDPGGNGDIEARVANLGMVNAVTLPGGKIIIFRGLLDDAKSVDEVAGILGHEIGHVRNRDVMAALLRQAGLGVLLGGLGGDVSGAQVSALLSATYSRGAEAEADSYSIGALNRAHISTVATATFFKRLAAIEAKLGKAGAALGYISTHPMSDARERRFAAGTPRRATTAPALDQAQWKALANICGNEPKAKPGSWFGL